MFNNHPNHQVKFYIPKVIKNQIHKLDPMFQIMIYWLELINYFKRPKVIYKYKIQLHA